VQPPPIRPPIRKDARDGGAGFRRLVRAFAAGGALIQRLNFPALHAKKISAKRKATGISRGLRAIRLCFGAVAGL
jgi:hypothetical protein